MNAKLEYAVEFHHFCIEQGIKDPQTLAEVLSLRKRISDAACQQNKEGDELADKLRDELIVKAQQIGYEIECNCHLPTLVKVTDDKRLNIWPPAL